MSSSRVYRTRGPAIEKFFRSYLRHPYGKAYLQPFVMEPWQRLFTNYAHQLDANGDRVFKTIILGIPRGCGKSPLAAGYGLYEMMARKDAPHVYCLAASKGQALTVHNFARGFVEAGPLMAHGVRPGRNRITFDKGGAFFEALAASGLLVHGKNAAVLIGDELHAFTTAAQVETWDGMWTTMQKRENSYGLIITTAGFNKQTLLGLTYEDAMSMPLSPIVHSNPCLRIHEDRARKTLIWWYGIPEDRAHEWEDRELWRKSTPASWLNVSDLEDLLSSPTFRGRESSFKRLILNMWTTSEESWLPDGVWSDLRTEDDEFFPKGTKIWVGVDVGWNDDSTAVVWCTRMPDGKIAIRAKIWTTRRDQVGEFVDGGHMRLELVERFILDKLKRRYKIQEVACDPSWFGRSMEILEQNGLRRKLVEMPPWHGATVAAWNEFKDLAVEGQLSHTGDPNLAAHVAAAGTRQTNNGPRVSKLESGKIDALAAAVLAVSRCNANTNPNRGAPGVFWIDPEDPTNLHEPDAPWRV